MFLGATVASIADWITLRAIYGCASHRDDVTNKCRNSSFISRNVKTHMVGGCSSELHR